MNVFFLFCFFNKFFSLVISKFYSFYWISNDNNNYKFILSLSLSLPFKTITFFSGWTNCLLVKRKSFDWHEESNIFSYNFDKNFLFSFLNERKKNFLETFSVVERRKQKFSDLKSIILKANKEFFSFFFHLLNNNPDKAISSLFFLCISYILIFQYILFWIFSSFFFTSIDISHSKYQITKIKRRGKISQSIKSLFIQFFSKIKFEFFFLFVVKIIIKESFVVVCLLYSTMDSFWKKFLL